MKKVTLQALLENKNLHHLSNTHKTHTWKASIILSKKSAGMKSLEARHPDVQVRNASTPKNEFGTKILRRSKMKTTFFLLKNGLLTAYRPTKWNRIFGREVCFFFGVPQEKKKNSLNIWKRRWESFRSDFHRHKNSKKKWALTLFDKKKQGAMTTKKKIRFSPHLLFPIKSKKK